MCHWWFPKYTLQFWTRTQKWTIGRGDILRKWSCSPSILKILNCVLGYLLGNSYTRPIWVDYNPITNHLHTNFQQNILPNILVAVASIFGVPSNLFHKEIMFFFQKKTFDTMRCDSKQFFLWPPLVGSLALWGWTASTTTIAEKLWLLIQRNPHFLGFLYIHRRWSWDFFIINGSIQFAAILRWKFVFKNIYRCLAIFHCDPAFNQQWVLRVVKLYSHFPTMYLFWYTAFPYVYHIYIYHIYRYNNSKSRVCHYTFPNC